MKNIGILFVFSLSFIAQQFNFENDNVSKPIVKNVEQRSSSSKINYNSLFESKYEILSKLFIDRNTVPSIEYANSLEVANTNLNVLYIDFIGHNGFLVINDDTDEIYEFNDSVDLAKLRQTTNYLYSLTDSFIVYNENKDVFEKIYDENYKDIVCAEGLLQSSPVFHNGQISWAGDGQIYDLDAYVADRYPNYTFVESRYIRNYQWAYMSDNSLFRCKTYDLNGNYLGGGSEGNCVINAVFSMLSNLPTAENEYGYCYRYNQNYLSAYNSIDYSNSINNDSQYLTYIASNFVGTNDDGTTYEYEINDGTNTRGHFPINDMPTLYMQLREVAIEYGYTPDGGMNSDYAKEMVENTDQYYSYDLELNLSSSKETVISNIRYNVPSLIGTSGSETYSGHTMAVYGYAKYSYQQSILWWTQTKYSYFWMVDSGWGPTLDDDDGHIYYDEFGDRINWFDPNQCTVNFMTLNRNRLTWPTC